MKDLDNRLPLELTRRRFCAHACQAASLVAFGSLVAGCGGSPTSPSGGSAPALPSVDGIVSGGRVSITVDASSPLNNVGSAAIIRASSGSYLASRTGQDTFAVLTAICTHEGCTIDGFQSSTYVCPCHGSQFNVNGGVTKGPASQSLTQFASTFSNGALSFAT